MNEERLITGPVKGYKILDANLCCRGVQFKIGEIVRHDGPLEMCKSGFHFCPYPSGVWAYYNNGRVFEVEAYDILDTPTEPGADLKRVCHGIKLVREIEVDGDDNTGHRNTGHRNTGDYNTGDSNTGDYNTGDYNTGDSNTGDYNTGDRNTGDRNTGDRNTGYSNTGHRNTGHRNTGDSNTGDYNTGYGNACDRSAGHFCTHTPKLIMFDEPTDAEPDHELVWELSVALSSDEPFDPTLYLSLPNATATKIRNLHKLHIERRKGRNST